MFSALNKSVAATKRLHASLKTCEPAAMEERNAKQPWTIYGYPMLSLDLPNSEAEATSHRKGPRYTSECCHRTGSPRSWAHIGLCRSSNFLARFVQNIIHKTTYLDPPSTWKNDETCGKSLTDPFLALDITGPIFMCTWKVEVRREKMK